MSTDREVSRFRMYDISIDEYVTSRRLGTFGAIERLGGIPIPQTNVIVPASAFDEDCPGFTKRDYDPATTY